MHHAWLLVLLARVRCRRGRLAEAEATLRSAREAIGELAGQRASPVARRRGRARARRRRQSRAGPERSSTRRATAELAVLRLLDSELSTRQIGEELFLSAEHRPLAHAVDLPQARRELARRCRRARTRARLARASGITYVIPRPIAPRRGEWIWHGPSMPHRAYRLILQGELSEVVTRGVRGDERHARGREHGPRRPRSGRAHRPCSGACRTFGLTVLSATASDERARRTP